jgi:hypothetical protein
MTTQTPVGQLKLGLFLVITLSIVGGGLAMGAFGGWLRGDSSYLLQGMGAALLVGVVLLHAYKLLRVFA